jgi:hypothetical protein
MGKGTIVRGCRGIRRMGVMCKVGIIDYSVSGQCEAGRVSKGEKGKENKVRSRKEERNKEKRNKNGGREKKAE